MLTRRARNPAGRTVARKPLRWLLTLLLALGLVLASLAAYLASADLGPLAQRLLPHASDALGRSLTVGGELSLRIGERISLEARDVRLADAPWGEGPTLFRADAVRADLRLGSLFGGPLEIDSITVENGHARLVVDEQGRRNWSFGDSAQAGGRGVRIGTVGVRDLAIELSHPKLTGTPRLELDALDLAHGPDASRLELTGALDALPLEAAAALTPPSPGGTRRLDASVDLGRIRLETEADLEAVSPPELAFLRFRLAGPETGDLVRALRLPVETQGPLTVGASLETRADELAFDAEGTFGEYRLAADGVVPLGGRQRSASPASGSSPARSWAGKVALEGPDLRRLMAPFLAHPLPPGPFRLSSTVQIDAAKLALTGATLEHGALRASADIAVASKQRRVEIDGLTARSGAGHLSGALAIDLDGPVALPAFDLAVRAPAALAAGAGLAAPAALAMIDEARARGRWGDAVLEIEAATAALVDGRGQVDGTMRLTRADPPEVAVRLEADRLDLRPADGPSSARPSAATALDRPLPTAWLQAARGEVALEVGELWSEVTQGGSLAVAARLEPGRLTVERFETDGPHGALLGHGSLRQDGDGLGLALSLSGEALRLPQPGLSAEAQAGKPAYGLTAELEGRGRTGRELLSSAGGRILVEGGPGVVPRGSSPLVALVLGDFLFETVDAVNPLTSPRETVALDCVVLDAKLRDGVVRGDPVLALQTRTLKLAARGTVDLGSGALDLEVASDARRGIGISLGDFVTPFVRLGGTLSAPQLVGDARRGLLDGGLSVLTGGAWLALKKLKSRFLDGNPCEAALAARDRSV